MVINYAVKYVLLLFGVLYLLGSIFGSKERENFRLTAAFVIIILLLVALKLV